MQPTENPYASPSTIAAPTFSTEEASGFDQQLALAKRVTRFPALGMLICSMHSILLVGMPLSLMVLLGTQEVKIHWLGRHVVAYWPIYFVPFSFYVAASFFGSLSLLQCHHRVLAKIGCFFSLMPLVHPLFPIAIPFGFKGRAVLRNPEVDLAFRRAELDERSTRARALARLFGPASIFLLLSWLTITCIFLPALSNIFVYPYLNPEGAETFLKIATTTVLPRVTIAATGAIFVAYAAIQMLRGRQYWVCILAAATSLLPLFTPCLFLGIPIGLWTLILLLQKETRAAFAEVN